MIKISPKNIISIKHEGYYYYCIILTNIIIFGGNMIYAFHLKTKDLLESDQLLNMNSLGFNIVADLIQAKRENRITKLGKINNIDTFWKYKFFKTTITLKGKANEWFIYDENNTLVKRTHVLSETEKKYPNDGTVNEKLLIELINKKWLPENDERI